MFSCYALQNADLVSADTTLDGILAPLLDDGEAVPAQDTDATTEAEVGSPAWTADR